jgi:hypothetical protein
MIRPVGRFARILAVAVGALVVLVGALYVAVPPNVGVDDGAADPILFLRRPVFRVLDAIGVVHVSARRPNRYLPSRFGVTAHEELASGERRLISKEAWRNEPVYRGLFWSVGSRVTYRIRFPGSDPESREALRLCYLSGGRRSVAAQVRWDAASAEVTGFVPAAASGYWVEQVGRDGRAEPLAGWGDTGDVMAWD